MLLLISLSIFTLVSSREFMPICPRADLGLCDISQTITSCTDKILSYQGNATTLRINGTVNLSSQANPGPCFALIANVSISFEGFNLTAPDVQIRSGLSETEYDLKHDYYIPGGGDGEPSILVDQTSVISASGKSTKKITTGQGVAGSFAANGGSDASITQATQIFAGHGTFDMSPYDEDTLEFQFGTEGQNDERAGGGGRIVMSSPGNLQIDGNVTARGIPYFNSSADSPINGGSGGYIALDVGGYFSFGGFGNLDVSGGDGIANGFGGSGGRIVFNGKVKTAEMFLSKFLVTGGGATNCQNTELMQNQQCGGAGTVYQTNTYTLDVGPNIFESSKRTPIKNTDNINSIYISSFATACPYVEDNEPTPIYGDDISIAGTVASAYLNPSAITLKGGSISILQGGKIDGTGVVNILVNASRTIDIASSTQTLINGAHTVFNSQGAIIFDKGTMQGTGSSTLSFIGNTINITSTAADITVNRVSLISYTYIDFAGSIKATETKCNSQRPTSNSFSLGNSYLIQCSDWRNKKANQSIDDIVKTSFSQFYDVVVTNLDLLPWQLVANMSKSMIEKNYTIFLLAQNELFMRSEIVGSIIGICADNITHIGRLDAGGRGCSPDQGAGSGLKNVACAGAGASYGTYGGYGGSVQGEGPQDCGSNPYVELKKTKIPDSFYIGSGGASSGTDSSSTVQGGAGGGMILLNAKRQTIINGSLSANGADASAPSSEAVIGAGGGSGGLVYVHTTILQGNGYISASGGRGSSPGGGGGAGGAFYLMLKDYQDVSTFPACTQGWTRGDPVILPGTAGASGAGVGKGMEGDPGFLQSSPCAQGYGNHTCEACQPGYYRSSFSNVACQLCTNLPANAAYNTTAWVNENCPYKCINGYTMSDSGSCLSEVEEFFDRIGDIVILIVGIIVFLLLIIGFILCCRLKSKNKKKKLLKSQISDRSSKSALLTDSVSFEQGGRSAMQKRNFMRKEFGVQDLPYHECRVYFFGSNGLTRASAWTLPREPHPYVRNDVHLDRYAQYIEHINSAGKWTCAERLSMVLLCIVMPLLAIVYHQKRRSAKAEQVRQALASGKENFWKKLRMRELSGSVKLSTSADNTLGYLDFMNWDKSRLDWVGVPSTPLTLLFSGNGSFSSPYALQGNDPLVEAIGDMLSRAGGNSRRIHRVLVLLNAQLSALSFYDLNCIYQTAMGRLVLLVDRINMSYFWPNNYSLQLVAYFVQNNQLRFQTIHSQNYLNMASSLASCVRGGCDAKLGIRIESHKFAGSTMESTFGTLDARRLPEQQQQHSQALHLDYQNYEASSSRGGGDESRLQAHRTSSSPCCCSFWLAIGAFIRVLYFQRSEPKCSRCCVRFLYILLILCDIVRICSAQMLSMVPVLYAFEHALRVPYICIFFVYPLIPVISIALNIICLIVWHPMFLRVLLNFNAVSSINPLTTLILAAALQENHALSDGFWLLCTIGMLIIKIPVARVGLLHLAWLEFAGFKKYKQKLAGMKNPSKGTTSKGDFQSRQFAQQIRDSGNWPFRRQG